METLSGRIGMILPTFDEYPNRRDSNEVIPFMSTMPTIRILQLMLYIFLQTGNLQFVISQS